MEERARPPALSALMLLLGFAGTPSYAAALPLSAYLSQVSQGHQGVQAAQMIRDGSQARASEGDILTAPSFFANAQHVIDDKINPFFVYNRTITDTYSLGINQQTAFGLLGKLSYNLTYTEFDGLEPGFGPSPPNYYEGRPQLDLTLSLWRNGFGSETRAQVIATEAAALASHFGESYEVKTTLFQAESVYWRLALARENVTVEKDALDRAQKIYDWNARRERLQLADRADVLQADAALITRKLSLQAAYDEVRAASRAFNLARGLSKDEVGEDLDPLSPEDLRGLKVPERAERRDDVLSAEQQSRATAANAKLAVEKDTPTLEVFSSLALNSHTQLPGTAMDYSFHDDRPTYLVGVRFSAPLDFGTVSAAKDGWRKEEAAADLTYQRKLFEQESDWKDLTQKLDEARRRFEIANQIEDAQQKKLVYERKRLDRGRTTTYQVLLFEQDYQQAQLGRIQAEADILNLIAQMKVFGGGS